MSEKFDGYRGFRYEEVDGVLVGKFYSRNNKSFNAPDWFLDSMPPPDLLVIKSLMVNYGLVEIIFNLWALF